ncbi:MAG: hypothetical protein HGA85_02045 [Nanoarchaeota archaeon]|nr:hypothetical protein [Nanoarchaeota archaeon]
MKIDKVIEMGCCRDNGQKDTCCKDETEEEHHCGCKEKKSEKANMPGRTVTRRVFK